MSYIGLGGEPNVDFAFFLSHLQPITPCGIANQLYSQSLYHHVRGMFEISLIITDMQPKSKTTVEAMKY